MWRRSSLLLFAVLACACPGPVEPLDAGSDAGADGGVDGGAWWRERVFYEVFVRSFADSDGDGVGDLRGLTQRLDVLNDGDPATTSDLGVDALWLMPTYPSPTYHGYDVLDYQGVNPAYGTMADMEAFLAAAHARGMKVILDFVPNHTSVSHPWFAAASSSPTSPTRDHYVWRDTDPGRRNWYRWQGAYYYAYFTDSMPDLNHRNEEVAQALLAAMRFWLAKGVDGFRVDAARYLVEADDGGTAVSDLDESHQVARRWRRELTRDFPDMVLVAEAWAPTSTMVTYWGEGDEYHLAFNFSLAEAMIRAARAGKPDDVVNTIDSEDRLFAGKDRGFQAPFLTNHDHVRVARQLEGDAAAMRLLAAVYLAQPGTPFLYYGEEIGMVGGAALPDENKRTPLRWTGVPPGFGFTTGTPWFQAAEDAGVDIASQQADVGSLWHLYRRLITLRRATPALATGASRWLRNSRADEVFALERTAGASRVLFLANFATTPVDTVDVELPGTPTVLESDGLTGQVTRDGAQVRVQGLAPRGFVFIQLN